MNIFKLQLLLLPFAGHCAQLQEGKRRRQLRSNANSGLSGGPGVSVSVSDSSGLSRGYDQNGEIQQLQETLDTLRHTLDRDEAELRDSSDELFALQRLGGGGGGSGGNGVSNLSLQSESTMRSIIDR